MRLLAAILLSLVLAAPASAHVEVRPTVARPGDTVELTFKVPNERADAATTGLELFLPPGVPAKVAPHPGWTSTDRGGGDIAFAPDTPAQAIGPGRAQEFKVTLGPLPKADRIVFKALQTYADGEVVRWIQATGPDDERPAAILDLSGNGAPEGDENGAWPLYLGGVLGLLIVIVGVAVTRRRRSVM
ncbi:YcnI family protein [Solirubrobacter phytolaccae]|uniref:YcnI family protein n=1 Tax=Solirubrobacter phytolaccae TaxID=1404360 RepID=A0A9X3S7M1_9ACTN|nr:DUF1775 domain-containing protein [Solirubrobacter phytolaccae]MDA0180468.1 YcnI family protein [Solirubrobacter phytolaccae]